MAESIIVHLSQATDSELTDFLNGQAERIGPEDWRYPNEAEYTVSLYLYPSILNECDPDDVQAICDRLGGRPATSLALELRRSRGDDSLCDATRIALKLLARFDGLVDDTYYRLWTRTEIESDTTFLDCYRVRQKPHSPQV